jgi:DNA sulfur modification protein DndC
MKIAYKSRKTTLPGSKVSVMGVDSRIRESFEVLDKALSKKERVVIAYSGGKDSTALALLLLQWIASRERPLNIVLLHGDTLSEIPEMESWARAFAERYVDALSKYGVHGTFEAVKPEPWETFYWRVLVRGYPAPSFKWRWCVDVLKRRPSLRFFRNLGKDSVVLLGHRDSESRARARALSARTGSCPLAPGSCFAFYMSLDGNWEKVYPIRSWSEGDVWSYIEEWGKELRDVLDKLYRLYCYGTVPARYGCWHCTLVKVQLGHVALGEKYVYFEAVRKLYRAVSDLPELRAVKSSGYSRLGFLRAPARSLLLKSMLLAEELSGIRLYGLDETKVNGFSLREVFWEMPESEADRVIEDVERSKGGNLQRIVSVQDLRNVRKYYKDIMKLRKHSLVKNDEYVEEILDRLS